MTTTNATPRPLSGIRVLDASALGPGPFASMMLASHGADVLRVERPGGSGVDTEYFNKSGAAHLTGKVQVTVNARPCQSRPSIG